MKNGREGMARNRGILGDELADHPGVRAKRVRSRPVILGDDGVPPMIPLTDFALPIEPTVKPAVFVDPHRVGLPNIGKGMVECVPGLIEVFKDCFDQIQWKFGQILGLRILRVIFQMQSKFFIEK